MFHVQKTKFLEAKTKNPALFLNREFSCVTAPKKRCNINIMNINIMNETGKTQGKTLMKLWQKLSLTMKNGESVSLIYMPLYAKKWTAVRLVAYSLYT